MSRPWFLSAPRFAHRLALSVLIHRVGLAPTLLCSSGVRSLMMAMASTAIVPAIERWGVLVTNSGATVISLLGALYVFSDFSPSTIQATRSVFASTPTAYFWGHLNVLMTHRSLTVAFCGRRSVLERNCVLMLMSGFLPSLKPKRRSNDPSLRHPPKSRSCDSDRKFLTGHDDTYIDFSVVSWICKNMTKQRPRTSGIEESACDYRYI